MMPWSSVESWELLSSPTFADESLPDATQAQIGFTDEFMYSNCIHIMQQTAMSHTDP